jgi:hypothetical protein
MSRVQKAEKKSVVDDRSSANSTITGGLVGTVPDNAGVSNTVGGSNLLQFRLTQPTAGLFDVEADVGELRVVRMGGVGREPLGATPSPETIGFDTRHDGRLD